MKKWRSIKKRKRREKKKRRKEKRRKRRNQIQPLSRILLVFLSCRRRK